MEDAVRTLIQNTLGGDGWTVRRPEQGWSRTSFIAEHKARRVFVKFEAPTVVLRRLAAIGVAPAILADGEFQGVPYVVQEYVEGSHPDHGWFADHREDVVRLLRAVHQDVPLRMLLLPALDQRARALRDIEVAHHWVEASFPDHPGLHAAHEWLVDKNPKVQEQDLVPTHGDVSRKNFIITPSRVLLVDWDGVALANPLRDLGRLTWWYIPPSQWPGFLERYGISLTPEVAVRIYWWAAFVSFDVAAGLLKRGYRDDAVVYLGDFIAAASEQPNPRAKYRQD